MIWLSSIKDTAARLKLQESILVVNGLNFNVENTLH